MTPQGINKKILGNTVILYVRMLFNLFLALYTSRVVLSALGTVDYGIYNVVGGVLGMFMFLNSSLSSSIQRFYSFHIGEGNKEKLRQVFGSAFILHISLGIFIVICAEIIGTWFIDNELNFPENRYDAVFYVFQFTVLSAFCTILQIPFLALLIAREKFSYYAYVTMGEATLKLLLVLLLSHIPFDRLVVYAFLMFMVCLFVSFSYIIYCRWHFEESHYLKPYKSTLKSLFGFWGIFVLSPFSWMTIRQGLNILLNIFYGPVVNASRAVASQVDNAVSGVITNLRTAMNPQVVKLYASGDMDSAQKLTFDGAKVSFFLLSIVALPVILEARFILNIWLVSVPDYAVVFCQLVLINSLLQTFDGSFDVLFQATEKIKLNYICTSIVYLGVLPVSYIILKNNICPPTVVFYVQIASTLVAGFFVKLLLLKRVFGISFLIYCKRFLTPIVLVFVFVYPIVRSITYMLPEGVIRFFSIVLFSSFLHIVFLYFFGISKVLRNLIKAKVFSFFLH